MKANFALANTGKGCVRIELPAYCPDTACRSKQQAISDEDAIERAIAAGVITR